MFRQTAIASLLAATSAPAFADVPAVVTDIGPVHSLVSLVMGDLAEPGLILPPGADPHSYSMRPSEADALEQADMVFWVGESLTPWLAAPMETLAGGAEHVSLMDADGTERLALRWADASDHADEHGHDEDDHGEDEHGEDDHDDGAHAHDPGAFDPHVWLLPENALTWLDVIAAHLSDADPDNADAYQQNAAAAHERLTALFAELNDTLAPVRSVDLVLFHDATQYFEAGLGLHAAGTMTMGESAPSPRRLSELAEEVAALDHACIVLEPHVSPGLARAVGADVPYAVIDLQGAENPTGPDFYGALLRGIADDLKGCL